VSIYHDGLAVVEAADGLGLERVEREGERLGRGRALAAARDDARAGGGRVVAFGVGDVVHAGDALRWSLKRGVHVGGGGVRRLPLECLHGAAAAAAAARLGFKEGIDSLVGRARERARLVRKTG
jgi:hypothetical protein